MGEKCSIELSPFGKVHLRSSLCATRRSISIKDRTLVFAVTDYMWISTCTVLLSSRPRGSNHRSNDRRWSYGIAVSSVTMLGERHACTCFVRNTARKPERWWRSTISKKGTRPKNKIRHVVGEDPVEVVPSRLALTAQLDE